MYYIEKLNVFFVFCLYILYEFDFINFKESNVDINRVLFYWYNLKKV